MTSATGVGSLPGDDLVASLRMVLDELGVDDGLPFLPELPGRGITAGMVGRSLALVSGVGVDLQPAGWRLTDSPGVDHRRARSLMAQDLDRLEEHTQGYSGAFKVQVAGPWTLAATVEKPRGDKVVSDHGARRDLAQALAEGLRDHVRDLRRRLADVDRLVVQVDEPALAAVMGGGVPTASGFGRHRVVHPPEASEHLAWVLSAITDEGAEPWVHACAPETPLDIVRGAGARGLVVDLGAISAAGHDVLGTALEAGETVVLGVIPSTDPGGTPVTDDELVERVVRWLDRLGLDPDAARAHLGLSTTCGMAGATPPWSRRALELTHAAASRLG